jgi:hypothetical protein
MTKVLVACALIGALGLSSLPKTFAAGAEDAGGPYRWNQYQIALPKAGWTVAGDGLDGSGNKRLSLQTGDGFLSVLITLFAKPPAPDPQTRDKPGEVAAALGMPLALKLAGSEGENAIALSYGSIDLSSGAAPLARFIIGAGKEFWTLDALLHVSEKGGAMYGALILGKGVRGKVDMNADHQRWIAEAYGIVRSISVTQK